MMNFKHNFFVLLAVLAMIPSVMKGVNGPGTQITLAPNQWASFCSSVSVNYREWYKGDLRVKVYYMVGFVNLTAKLVRVHDSTVPGVGVFLHNEGNETVTLTVNSYDGLTEDPGKSNYFIGVTTDTKIPQVEGSGSDTKYNYYLSTSKEGSTDYGLYRVPAEGITIPAGKAYCQLYANEEKAIQDYLSSHSNAKIGFEIIDDPETTGINEVKTEKSNVKNQNVYDLSGRLVGTSLKGLKPGLYIQGGKKIMK